MFKFNLPRPAGLDALLKFLIDQEVDLYLYGYLPGSEMPFVDIDTQTAGELSGQELPSSWTLIYPFFMSSDALIRNEPDPLLQGIPVADVLKEYQPRGFSSNMVKENAQALIEQAEYLMQFPPCRLVWLGGASITETGMEALKKVLAQSKKGN